MSIVFGLTPQGFFGKSLPQIQLELEQAFLNGPLGQGAAVDGRIPPGTAAGQLIAIIADAISELWQLAVAVYASFDPSQTTGASQDAVCSITGVIRQGATYSETTVLCVGVPDTALEAGRVVRVGTTGPQFASVLDATIASADLWVSLATYAVGDLVQSAGSVYRCKAVVTSATPPASDATNWLLLGVGTGVVSVVFKATDVGPLESPDGTLTNIVTPVFGWNTAYNPASATLGTVLESNTHLRIRREQELHSTGNATADAIRTKVLNVEVAGIPVASCSVFFNDTDSPSDGSTPPNMPPGMPPHSVMALADYAEANNADTRMNQAIGQAIYDALGAGIATTFGNVSGSYQNTTIVTDPQGNDLSIFWAIPEKVAITVVAAVTYDNTLQSEPTEADLQVMIKGGTLSNGLLITGAIPTAGMAYTVGRNVWASAVSSSIFASPIDVAASAQPVPGILAVTSITVNAGALVSISQTQRATFATSDITITLTGSAP